MKETTPNKQEKLTPNQTAVLNKLREGYRLLWQANVKAYGSKKEYVRLARPNTESDNRAYVNPTTFHTLLKKELIQEDGLELGYKVYTIRKA